MPPGYVSSRRLRRRARAPIVEFGGVKWTQTTLDAAGRLARAVSWARARTGRAWAHAHARGEAVAVAVVVDVGGRDGGAHEDKQGEADKGP
jgi:hypothetical protein